MRRRKRSKSGTFGQDTLSRSSSARHVEAEMTSARSAWFKRMLYQQGCRQPIAVPRLGKSIKPNNRTYELIKLRIKKSVQGVIIVYMCS